MITCSIPSILNTKHFYVSDKYTTHDAALLVIAKVERDLIYNGNTFYEWTGNFWQPIDENILARLSLHLLKAWTAAKASDFYKILATYCQTDINKNPLAIQLKNMVYDVERFKVYPPQEYKDDAMIGYLPIDFHTTAKCEGWLEFLYEVMQGDWKKIQLVQEFFGYCFLGDNRYQQALVLLGAGNNGKSVLLEVMGAMFDKVTFLDLKQIEDERYIHHIQGAWLNVASELSYKSVETTANIKKVIAGEEVQAAPKYHKGFSFRPRAKIAFATNGLPRNNDTSQGYFRRLLIINMSYSVVKPNRNIINELKQELPGIFNWAVEGLKSLMSRGSFDYENPYVELYKEESSSLYAWWVEEGFAWMSAGNVSEVFAIDDTFSFKDFYSKYVTYSTGGGMRPAGRNKIRSEMERLQLPVEIFTVGKGEKCVRLAK